MTAAITQDGEERRDRDQEEIQVVHARGHRRGLIREELESGLHRCQKTRSAD